MLLSNKCEIIKSIVVKLVFDDESVKERTINVKDLVNVTFNKDGMRRSIEGIVTRIEDENCCRHERWYIIVDGSTTGVSKIEKIFTDKILDIEVTRKANQVSSITTPIDSTRVTGMRFVGGVLQITQDGTHWISLVKAPEKESDILVDEKDQELAAKIARLIPKRVPADRRVEMIEGLVSLYKEELDLAFENHECENNTTVDPDDTTTSGDTTTTTPDVTTPTEPDTEVEDPVDDTLSDEETN